MPNSFDQIPLGELFEITKASICPFLFPGEEFAHHSLPAFDATGGPVIELGRQIESNKTLLTEPVVLLSKLNPRTSRVSVVDPTNFERRNCCSTEFIAYRAKHRETCIQFYGFFFQTAQFRTRLQNVAIGTTNSHVRATPAETLKWDVPNPDPREQVKIAKVLSTIDRAIERTEALIAKQHRVKTGLMHDLLTRGIDERGNLRSEQTHEFKESPLGRIPVDWEVCPLSSIAVVSSGVTLGGARNGATFVELPYLRVANVQDGFLDLRDIKTVLVDRASVSKYTLQHGDVLMNEGGDFDKLGRGAVWCGEIARCLHQNHVFKVRPQKDVLGSEFLAAVSSSPYGKAFFLLASKQSTNLASINATQLRAFPIPRPDYPEQLRIEKALRLHRNGHELILDQLRKFQSLRTALMHDLLTGKRRVTSLLAETEIATA